MPNIVGYLHLSSPFKTESLRISGSKQTQSWLKLHFWWSFPIQSGGFHSHGSHGGTPSSLDGLFHVKFNIKIMDDDWGYPYDETENPHSRWVLHASFPCQTGGTLHLRQDFQHVTTRKDEDWPDWPFKREITFVISVWIWCVFFDQQKQEVNEHSDEDFAQHLQGFCQHVPLELHPNLRILHTSNHQHEKWGTAETSGLSDY